MQSGRKAVIVGGVFVCIGSLILDLLVLGLGLGLFGNWNESPDGDHLGGSLRRSLLSLFLHYFMKDSINHFGFHIRGKLRRLLVSNVWLSLVSVLRMSVLIGLRGSIHLGVLLRNNLGLVGMLVCLGNLLLRNLLLGNRLLRNGLLRNCGDVL